MKKIILIIMFAFISFFCFSQKKQHNEGRHFKEEIYFTLSDGCVTSCEMTQTLYAGSPSFDFVKEHLEKYVFPNKLKRIDKLIITQIQKSQLRTTGNPFKCPEVSIQEKLIYSKFNPSYTLANLKSKNYWSFIWNNGNKVILRIQPLFKDSIALLGNPTDSIRILVKKSNVKWVNDSTAIIKK